MPHPAPASPSSSIGLVMPVLDEARRLDRQLADLVKRDIDEIVVVDGGSRDETLTLARRWSVKTISSPPGRARQLNLGAEHVTADCLLFLHADTRLPDDATTSIREALAAGHCWGRFDVCIEGRHPLLPIIATAMNWRSRLTHIATGDQAIFMTHAAFNRIGGFPDQPLMEDVEISRRLRRLAPPACLAARVTTSGRRWEQHGVWRTMSLMWRLRYRYWRGESPASLAREYRHAR
ncbi:transferase 2, rSAM/selenodomain-associated [Franzmannia pantelleriensis]|uniref:Transferase 2, rSAM/selenodomain-associated n=1 Tax=Franzmannia pantelleriensis TaxID=48727 RepID=A0A1G9JJX3_9GAMM|nr:TIGR04283 family arsenosugar biosynthesis glycosyltransferase [Halomonas pantelleriensis]SDL37546.1 transferase 2, rSAM/selenodomain-associated [Halomonas pantelleriensis]